MYLLCIHYVYIMYMNVYDTMWHYMTLNEILVYVIYIM